MHKMTDYKYSIIVPCYEKDKYIQRFIESCSVISKKFREIEFVFVDDGNPQRFGFGPK